MHYRDYSRKRLYFPIQNAGLTKKVIELILFPVHLGNLGAGEVGFGQSFAQMAIQCAISAISSPLPHGHGSVKPVKKRSTDRFYWSRDREGAVSIDRELIGHYLWYPVTARCLDNND